MNLGILFILGAAAVSVMGATERVAPPPGLPVREETQAALREDVLRLGRDIEFLDYRLREQPALLGLLPDVKVYHKAVDWVLRHDEFLRSNDVALAKTLLGEGLRRCSQLREGKAPWTTTTGLVVRGYTSRLDGSVQPYGLVVPASWAEDRTKPRRLDVWLHGRDNLLTELKFISDRQRSVGEFAPPDAVVLHPYGRYCNAFKFAGEMDVFEAIEAVQRLYPIDVNRRAIRGFSMGGAGCWHLAVHHPGFWAAAAPGAGFVETARYTGAFSKVPWPRAYEQRLWSWYDATGYALNLGQCPTFAYSGELDKQKQAADMMAASMKLEGLDLSHVIGPGTEHRYEPGAKREVAQRVDDAVASGRRVDLDELRFVTWTLRYNQLQWLTVEGLDEHWRRSVVFIRRTSNGFEVHTENISRFSAGLGRFAGQRQLHASIDGQPIEVQLGVGADRVWFVKRSGRWGQTRPTDDTRLRKRPGLQGPIDDAFLDRFLFVRPTGKPLLERAGKWVASALELATNEWRAQMRGDVPIKDDVAVTPEDIATSHLILWGDPSSNRLMARMAKKLPLRWTRDKLEVGEQGFPAQTSIPILVYPNPLNPSRYVVVNSGFTFWQSGDASNAQQTPKLPDYAVIDMAASLEQLPALGLISAGFFDEDWTFPSVR